MQMMRVEVSCYKRWMGCLLIYTRIIVRICVWMIELGLRLLVKSTADCK